MGQLVSKGHRWRELVILMTSYATTAVYYLLRSTISRSPKHETSNSKYFKLGFSYLNLLSFLLTVAKQFFYTSGSAVI